MWLSENRSRIAELNIEIEATQTGKQYSFDEAKLQTKNISENEDWFDIHIIVVVSSYEIPFVKFKKHIQERRRDFTLPDGRIFLLPEAWFTQYSDIFEVDESDEASIRIHKQHQGLLIGHPILSGEIEPTARAAVT
jgi:hypothetical protein